MNWTTLGKFALLVQPAVVAGLFFENAPSLTRAALTDNPASALLAWVIIVTTALAVTGLSWRCLRGRESPLIVIMPEIIQILAASMGLTAAIAASGGSPSVTLVVAYLVDSALLFGASILLAVERQRIRENG